MMSVYEVYYPFADKYSYSTRIIFWRCRSACGLKIVFVTNSTRKKTSNTADIIRTGAQKYNCSKCESSEGEQKVPKFLLIPQQFCRRN